MYRKQMLKPWFSLAFLLGTLGLMGCELAPAPDPGEYHRERRIAENQPDGRAAPDPGEYHGVPQPSYAPPDPNKSHLERKISETSGSPDPGDYLGKRPTYAPDAGVYHGVRSGEQPF